MILFAFFESTKVSYRKRGQSLTPRAHEGRCCNSPWGTGGSVSDHCAYSSDASGLLSPAVKLVGRLCYRLSTELKQRSLWNLSFLSLLCDKLIIKCLYKCGRREIAIFYLYHVIRLLVKWQSYVSLSFKRSKTCRTVLRVFNISPDVFHCFCRFTFVSISCDIDNFVFFFFSKFTVT